jgi:DNA-binding MarR family transcriptional regulator
MARYYQGSDYQATDDLGGGVDGTADSQGRRARAPAGIDPSALPPSMRDRVPFLLFRASAMSLALASEMLAPTTLNPRQVGILTMVTELEPMTQKDLGIALGIDRTTMVALLDDLEEKGHVTRQRHPRDRRAFLVHPTRSGRRAQAAAVRILDEQQRRFLAPLTPAERDQLADLIKRLLRSGQVGAV